jgi:SAM-dependent methyltransferase
VGTGRMALPLSAAGVEVVGVDLSEPMLRRLAENAAPASSVGSAVVPVALADAVRLPFADGVVGAAFGCHVLHLIPDWRTAVTEMVRVVRGGGLVLVDIGGANTQRGSEVGAFFASAAGAGRLRPGLTEVAQLEDALSELGCRRREPVVLRYPLTYSVGEVLERVESNQWSSTWALSDEVRLRAVADTRAWAEARWGDLGVPVTEEVEIVWRGFETPARSAR